ncbi:DUF6518 family protein [Streptomyces phaeochromogenes]|uniref:DUF6518 family protein n=1 Tax=Streptomyces phaeochromogenes TaxID=1923 RepID=UPI0036C7191C
MDEVKIRSFSPFSRKLCASFAATAGGVLVGTATDISSDTGRPVVSAAHVAMNSGWFWAALAYFVGLFATTKRTASLLGCTALTAAVISYYTLQLTQGKFEIVDFGTAHFDTHTYWAGYISKTIFWCVAACLVGSVVAVAGNVARHGRGKSVLIWRSLIPILAAVETFTRLHIETPTKGSVVEAVWSSTFLSAIILMVFMAIYETYFALRHNSDY